MTKPAAVAKPAAPKAAAKPANPTLAPAVEAPAATPVRTARPNSAYADQATRDQVTADMAKLTELGFTRPSISAVTKLTDSQVWRAQNGKVHTDEVPVLDAFIEQVTAGVVKPPARSRKVTVADLEAKIAQAIAVLANEAKTPAQFKKLVNEASELLSA